MSHSIVGRKQATKECTACHAGNSILRRPVDLNSFLPRDVPVMYRGRNINVVSYQGKAATLRPSRRNLGFGPCRHAGVLSLWTALTSNSSLNVRS
jgi:hypothetical protein